MKHEVLTLIQSLGLDKTYYLAYSGGLDSQVLLFILKQLQEEYAVKVEAIHVNHGLNPAALDWSSFCKAQCAAFNIPFHEHQLHLPLANFEANARDARYKIFSEYLHAQAVLLTAHHQDDQAETFLIQMLRGAGVKGLSSMPPVKQFATGLHARPFLSIKKSSLRKMAEQNNLQWIEDESNQNLKFARNFLRHEILPKLNEHIPAASTLIARSAQHCADAQSLLQDFSQALCKDAYGTRENTLSVSKLLLLNAAKQKLVLRAFIHSLNFPLPSMKKLNTILDHVLTARWDSLPCVRWGEVELRRYRDDLYLLPRQAQPNVHTQYILNCEEILNLTGIGSLMAVPEHGAGLNPNLFPLTIRFRIGGEKVYIPDRGNKTLKNLFNEWNVLPWERNRIPLFFSQEKIIGVFGYFWNRESLVGEQQKGFSIQSVLGDTIQRVFA